ncbi:MAG: RNA-binding protein, containing KH domain [Thermococcus sibiricus]|uniref:RNA-binding protein, containing KH domain n=2 Tax=Thermococcus sibiricus TaxID=172049 RepID=A0A101EMU3_9EURY|nr:MAG: RNA-binding protein, containing KH domain [Thermococcus sibiricus]
MGSKMREELKRMLKVDILEIKYEGDKVIVYVPKNQVRIAVGSGGSAVRAAELVLGKKIEIRGR